MKPSENQFAANLEALSVPQCRRVVVAISHGPLTLEELSKACKLSQGSIVKHVQLLVDAGLVRMALIEGTTKAELQMGALQPTLDWFSNFTS